MQSFLYMSLDTARFFFKWSLLAIPLSALSGSAVALFLWLLDLATVTRESHTWLLFFLPFAGLIIFFLYSGLGKNSGHGNNLILDEIHEPSGRVPLRMAPLVMGTTVLTHLTGGSAGREGTAVQMGGSLAAYMGRLFRLNAHDTRIFLTAGIAAGFGAVFGTPIAGAIFAVEVLAVGKIAHTALFPCLIASLMADFICLSWGITHTPYKIGAMNEIAKLSGYLRYDWLLLSQAALGGIAFGLAALIFSNMTQRLKEIFNQVPAKWTIPFLGGFLIILMTLILGNNDYLGIGVSSSAGGVTIVSAFSAGTVSSASWLLKIIFTAVTIASGFKGGEVTPLFFIGATLGNALAVMFGMPVDLMAALGFVAVFAAATNTPIACSLMAVELFGGEYLLFYALACFTAYYASGHSGIYASQKRLHDKTKN